MSASYLLLCVLLAFTTGPCTAVTQLLVREAGPGSSVACVSVLRAEDEPTGLTPAEQTQWHSKASVTVILYVEAFMHSVYNASAGTCRLYTKQLTAGQHLLEYSNGVGSKEQHTLDVALDGVEMQNSPQEKTYYTTGAKFSVIKIYAIGPLLFDWDITCSETAPTSTTSTTSSVTTTKTFPTNSTILPSNSSNSSNSSSPPLTTSSYKMEVPAIHDDESVGNFTSEYSRHSNQSSATILWSFVGAMAALTLVLLLYLVVCCWRNYCRSNKDVLRRRIVAERNKQDILRDAHRLSHLEQQSWQESSVDDDPRGQASRLLAVQHDRDSVTAETRRVR